MGRRSYARDGRYLPSLSSPSSRVNVGCRPVGKPVGNSCTRTVRCYMAGCLTPWRTPTAMRRQPSKLASRMLLIGEQSNRCMAGRLFNIRPALGAISKLAACPRIISIFTDALLELWTDGGQHHVRNLWGIFIHIVGFLSRWT